ncbi:hypothetical protein KAU43_04560, partial [candidate division WOR-3 bacterium]|nr:hypothetical protein [candidate division WOR-3 bacterium]
IPPTFVTLIGDVNVINTYPGIWASQYSDYAQATDLHYVRTDGTDIYPDMGIARISVSSLSEANEYVSKVINYEKFQFTSTDWLGRALFIASNDHASMLEGTHRYCMTTWLDPAGITSDSVWSSTGGSTADILSSINNGVVWVNYSGHGNVTYWDDPSFTASNISSLTNQDKYPFVVSNACLTGSFNSSTCFAESWIRNTGKGAIGHLGASNYSYWDEDDVFEPNLYEAFFDSMNFSTSMQLNIAKMLLADSLGETPNVKYYFEEYNIIGEPSVDLWMGIPSTMVISHNGTLPIGSSSYTVNVNIDNALVSLYYNDTLYGSSYSSGGQAVVTLSPSPDHTFDMLLTVTRHGYEPYFDTISVISPSGPFVVYLSSTIDDASGNNNGQINPGETIDLSVYLKNVGVAGATNVNAVLSTTDPDVIVNTDSSNYGNIAAGDSALSITDYDFTVGTVNNGHSI